MKNKSERGQSLVELAISLVILLFLLAGIVEFGLAFFQFVQLRDAAQEGALYGSTAPGDLAAIETRVRAASNTPINLDAAAGLVTVEIYVNDGVNDVLVRSNGTNTSEGSNATWLSQHACEAGALKVRAEYNHVVFMPFMSEIIGSSVPLNAEVTDTILTPVCSP
jgi:Flp pilus assembly protein TadG